MFCVGPSHKRLSCMSSSEIIPYVVGSLITLALIKWLFSKVEDRPIRSPSLYFSYSPDSETVRELQGMFPNIPRAYIVRELDRADGVSAVAIDNLLLMAADFMNSNDSNSSLTTPVISSSNQNPSTHHNILKSLDQEHCAKEHSTEEIVTKKNWDTIDSKTRHRLLNEKKREMLMKARESFLKRSE